MSFFLPTTRPLSAGSGFFPTKEDVVTFAPAYTGANNYNFTLPSGIEAGNRLVLFVAASHASAARTVSTPSGWTLVWTQASAAGQLRRAACFEKVADGTEGSSVNVTFSGNGVIVSGVCYRFSNAGAVYGTAAAWLAAGAPNPGNLAPGIGSQKFYWLAFCCYPVTSWNASAAPTNYSSLQSANGSDGGGVPVICRSRTAERQLAAASEDPANFGVSGSTPANYEAIVGTVAVKGS